MKAKKKPFEKLTAEELGVDLTPRLEILKVTEPPKRVGGQKVTYHIIVFSQWALRIGIGQVESVDELVAKLKEAGITAV